MNSKGAVQVFRLVIMWKDGTVTNTDHKRWPGLLGELSTLAPRERREMLAFTVTNVSTDD